MKFSSSLPIPKHEDLWGIVDSTKLQAFLSCPRAYFYEYALGWRSDRPSNHLIFGRAWHKALEYLYKNGLKVENLGPAFEVFLEDYRRDLPEETDALFGGKTPQAVLQALPEYLAAYASDAYDMRVLATEVYDQVLFAESQPLAVKLDLIYMNPKDEVCVMEHKTGSMSGQTWARQWALSIQVGAYVHACNLAYGQNTTPLTVSGSFFLKTKRNFERVACLRSEAAQRNWASIVSSTLASMEEQFELLSECRDSDPILYAFPMRPVACNSYSGCQFHDLCTCVANPLRLGPTPPIGFVEYWWNPLQEE